MRAGFVAVLILLGGYVIADSVDIAPGILTMADPPPEPAAYPTLEAAEASLPDIPGQSEGSLPSAEAVEAAVNELASDDRITGSLSMTVADPASGTEIYSRDGTVGRIPASNMKLLTGTAVLTGLGPEATLDTTAVLADKTVYLVGGGDTQLAAEEGDPDAIVGHAGLGDLADQVAQALKASDIDSVEVKVDTSMFDTPDYFASLDEADRIYVMAMAPIAVEGGKRADGTLAPDPAGEAVDAFAAALADRGITVTSAEGARGVAPEATAENTLGVVHSAPLREVVERMLTVSDNTIAQSLGHVLAAKTGHPANFSGAADAVLAQLAARGYDLTGIEIEDCAGLSIENRITTSLLAEILAEAASCDCELSDLGAGLPISHLTGTLSNRFEDPDLHGLVRAKTGTLVRANSLSGYMVVPGGRLVSFSILIDGIEPGTTRIARAAIDDCLEKIAAGKESS